MQKCRSLSRCISIRQPWHSILIPPVRLNLSNRLNLKSCSFATATNARKADKKRDYYAVLGVNKNSSEQEIKAAYRKLAMKYHPDRNQDNKAAAEEAFKEVSEAYAALSDPQKRANYDNYGSGDFGAASPFSGGGFQGRPLSREEAEALFNGLFGKMGGLGAQMFSGGMAELFRQGAMGGNTGGGQSQETTIMRNSKGQTVMRTRTMVRMPDGTVKESVTEKVLN